MPRIDKTVISYKPKRRKRTYESVNKSPKERKMEIISEESTSTPDVCQFCLSSEDNDVDLGPIHKKEGITVHYYCLLLSSGLAQTTRPSDKKSLLGFALSDIDKELRRGKRLTCCFCHKKGATIGCNVSYCRKAFHLRCGRQNGTMHRFFDTFESFCADHWSHPGWCTDVRPKNLNRQTCSICLMSFSDCKQNDIIATPCCKQTYFHHKCIQKYALSAGMHYFKCPHCNASKDFQKAMLLHGIYIPDRDASWEKEPNAFHELMERPSKCEISPCSCPDGEKHNARSGDFKLLICVYCGSYGAHKACAGIYTRNGQLICSACRGT